MVSKTSSEFMLVDSTLFYYDDKKVVNKHLGTVAGYFFTKVDGVFNCQTLEFNMSYGNITLLNPLTSCLFVLTIDL